MLLYTANVFQRSEIMFTKYYSNNLILLGMKLLSSLGFSNTVDVVLKFL